ncbi:MAG: hypothetical protein WDZ41_05715 [Candidatus Babeliales bacterium]
MLKKQLLIFLCLLALKLTDINCSWQVTYNPQKNEYCGTKQKWPHLPGRFKYFSICVCSYYINKQLDGQSEDGFDGYAINDYGDGNDRSLSSEAAKKYFEKFEKLCESKNKI